MILVSMSMATANILYLFSDRRRPYQGGAAGHTHEGGQGHDLLHQGVPRDCEPGGQGRLQ